MRGHPEGFFGVAHHQPRKRKNAMTANVGKLDRIARVILGLALLAYAWPYWFAPSAWNWVGWIGMVPLLTGVFGTCPAYSLLGISTCPLDSPR
jgi:hypothetical protein